MTIITTQTVRTIDLLDLVTLPPKPTMIPSVSVRVGINPSIARAVVAASVPSPRRIERRVLPTIDLTPRSARSHLALALEGAI